MRAKKFILIDHSLEKVGGHNYEYAIQMGRAAEQSGLDVVLATHHRFRPHDRLLSNWSVYPLFPFDSLDRYCLYKSGQLWNPVALSTSQGIARRLSHAWRRYRGMKLLSQFAHSCDRLFRQVSLKEGDVVFVPTLSEFDLLGLTQYLKSASHSRKAVWLLQFHFDLLQGRTPEYADQQPRIFALRKHFLKAFRELSAHRVALLSPTKRMADQYNQLGLATFHELAYPVSSGFRPPRFEKHHSQPVRIALAGHFRREKGRHLLGKTIECIWDDTLSTGRGQLMIQGRASQIRRWLPHSLRTTVTSNVSCDTNGLKTVVAVKHPLSSEDYADYIRQAGIGLFLYDSRRYFARCSGVLVEMLASGVPVIVPAGCWLAEQITEAIYQYQNSLLNRLPVVGRTNSSSLVLSDTDRPATVELPVPNSATGLLVRFRCQSSWPIGTYVRVTGDAAESTTINSRFTSIVGNRTGEGRVPVWIPLPADARQIQLRWANAYDQGRVVCCDVQFCFLGKETDSAGRIPQGAVGLIAAKPEDVPTLVDEMLTHYTHYRETAIQFAAAWRQTHSPQHVLRQLCSRADELLPLGEQLQSIMNHDRYQRYSV